ncbi:Uncharacterised protein [uncultured archaeon]|nr:Uncharacterised protein [uncultured archaeon]
MKTSKIIIAFVLISFLLNFVSATDEPKLISVTDSLGNIQTNSWATTGQGSWKPELRIDPTNNLYCSNCIIKIGDTITFTILANQQNLDYRCYDGATGNFFSDWSKSNTCKWVVQREDYGQSDVIMIGIRNDNGLDYMGNGHGDDYTYMTYKVVENDSEIVIQQPEPVNESTTTTNGENGQMIEDYSNCEIKIENYCPNTQECQSYHIPNCSCGSYKDAWCEDGIKIIEKISDSPKTIGSTSAGRDNSPTELSIQNNTITHINTTEACNGCLMGETCVAFGYRFNETYCDLSKNFISQKKAETACDNNFECSSNVCVSGKCVNAGLLQRILDWFKSIFHIKN